MRRLHQLCFLAAAAAPLACSAPSDTAASPAPTTELSLWSEFLSDSELDDALPLLVEEGADLNLAIPSTRIGDPSLAALIHRFDDSGITVNAWLLLPEDQGYWPNEHNVPQMRAAAMQLADWRDEASLPLHWIVFDMEMALERTRAVADVIAEDGAVAGLTLLKEGRDPDAFAENRDALAALIDDLQARDFEVMCVTYPTVLDDPLDGDDDIQDQLDVPIYGVGWDRVSFMVYQSLIYDLAGSWKGPDIIHSYAKSAVTDFDARASVALGIVGSAGITPVAQSYPDAPTLIADQAAALSAGVKNISIYSLDGVTQQARPEAWIDRSTAPLEPRYVDAEDLRGLIQSVLDD